MLGVQNIITFLFEIDKITEFEIFNPISNLFLREGFKKKKKVGKFQHSADPPTHPPRLKKNKNFML